MRSISKQLPVSKTIKANKKKAPPNLALMESMINLSTVSQLIIKIKKISH